MAKEDKKKSKSTDPKKQGFFRGTLSLFFDLPRWINAQQYVDTNKTLYRKIKDTFRIAKAQREETFEAAMQRLKVTEQDVMARIQHNQRVLIILLIFIALLFVYGLYLLFQGAIGGVLLLFAVMIFTSVRAFQYSFWNFQMRNRKLGCSFQDWLRRNKTRANDS